MNVPITRHLLHVGVILGLLAIALYLPFRVFGVVPFTRTYEVSDTEIARLLSGLNLPDYYAQPTPDFPAAELQKQQQDFLWCRFCHTLKAGEGHRVGPNLHRIMGRPAGVVRDFPYSIAFLQSRDSGVVWTPETLDSFLSDPHNYVPGNRMRFAPITDPEQRRRVIARLIESTR